MIAFKDELIVAGVVLGNVARRQLLACKEKSIALVSVHTIAQSVYLGQ